MPMTFGEFSQANRARCESPQGFKHPLTGWSTSEWMVAVIGEMGEAANVVKKLNLYRDKVTEAELRDQLRKELGDVFVLSRSAGAIVEFQHRRRCRGSIQCQVCRDRLPAPDLTNQEQPMPTPAEINAAANAICEQGFRGDEARRLAQCALEAAEATRQCGTVADLFCDWPRDYQVQFWTAYPHKVGKAVALRALDKVKATNAVTWETIMGGLEKYINYVKSRDGLEWCNPSTWLNGARWLDQPANGARKHSNNGLASVTRDLMEG